MTPSMSASRTRKVAGVWLGALASAALLLTPVAGALTSPPTKTTDLRSKVSPAQQLFDQVNALLQKNYGGLSTVDRAALLQEYQQRLNAVCSANLSTCPIEKSFPVVQAEIEALNDEHTYFQVPEDFDDFLTRAQGGERRQFGVKLAELDGERRVVLEVLERSAASEAGLQRGDVLQTIDGGPYTYDGLSEARQAGRPIRLGFDRRGVRLSVTVTPRESSTSDLPRISYVGPQKNVALLRIPTFLSGGGVAQKVHDLVAQARADRASGIIVDLRGDEGGSLTECDGAISAFVPQFDRVSRTVGGNVQARISAGTRQEDGQSRTTVKNPQLWTGPLAVLVDQNSASCSEFFAYEVQYARRGPVVGEETAGVGNTSTRVFPTGGNSALQLTVTNYVKPDGTPYPMRITPDQRRELTEDDTRRLTQGEDTLLDMALSALLTAPILAEREH